MSVTQTTPQTGAPTPRQVSLVDCDIHPTLTMPELQKRISERWRRHLDRFGRRTPMITEFYPRTANAGFRLDSWPEGPGGFPGSDLGLLQTQLLDEFDIDYGILNSLGLLNCHEMPELAAEMARALNDWMVEWMDEEPRLLGAMVVPYEYPELAVKEIERCAGDPRWVQLIFPDSAEDPLGSRKYWPIYEAATGHGLPIAVHTAGYWPHLDTGWPSYYLEEHVANSMRMQSQLTNFICEGTFTQFPDMRLVLTEAGVAWVVPLTWALDSAWEQLKEDSPPIDRRPSEIVREHVWFTTQPIEEPDTPEEFAQMISQAGLEDRLLFATDYPHWDFDSPTQALPRSIGDELRQKILAGNAAELYGLPLAPPE
jgi:predicted TIM-barrel fold metal-dependent hydrolase|nr:amidohydrolase family protein [Solirubrobacteraceae bacterium]